MTVPIDVVQYGAGWQKHYLAGVISTPPHPKERARHATDSQGNPHTYTPEETVIAEHAIAVMWKARSGFRGLEFWGTGLEPVRLTVWAYVRRPKSSRRVLPTVRPDGDNYLKLVQDALNGIAWKDDAQVTDARIIKRYVVRGGSPCLYIRIEDDVPTDEELLAVARPVKAALHQKP